MAFEGLTEKISSAFKHLRSKGRLTESDIKDAMVNADKAWTTTAISPSRFQSYLPFSLSLRCLPADGPLSLSRGLENVLLFFSTFRIDNALNLS